MSGAVPPPEVDRRTLRRVATTVLIGTAIEWYDFLLYSSAAALIFGSVFFPDNDPTTALLLSLSTFAVGYFARPVGSLVFGHFGDRLGRKRMLVLSLGMMGTATFLMGLIPSYASIGIAAPILLVVLRIVQGIGVGGEWGGAMLTALEYAPREKRGLYGSLPQFGLPTGIALASLVMLAVTQLSEEALLSWGWRIPFLLSGVLVAFGFYVRSHLEETPVFKQMASTQDTARIPLVEVVREQPKRLFLMTVFCIGSAAFFYTFLTYSAAYAADRDFTAAQLQVALLAAAVLMMVGMPAFGILGQRFSRAHMLMASSLIFTGLVFVIFAAIDSRSFPLLVVVFAVTGLAWSFQYGVAGTYLAESFPARFRYTATAIPFHFGAMLGGGLTPIVGAALVGLTGNAFAIELFVAVLTVVAAAALFPLRRASAHDDRDLEFAGTKGDTGVSA